MSFDQIRLFGIDSFTLGKVNGQKKQQFEQNMSGNFSDDILVLSFLLSRVYFLLCPKLAS